MNPPKLLSPREAAEVLGLSVATLATWRSEGRVPLRFVRCGRHIKYRLSDLIDFIDKRTENPGALAGAAR